MNRTVQANEDDYCDVCGATPSFDFMGDVLCQKCIEMMPEEEGYDPYE